MDFIWQSILQYWIQVALAFIGGAVVTWLKHKGSRWVTPVCYGLGVMVALLVIAILIQSLGSRRPDPISLEPTLRKWLYAYHMNYNRLTLGDTHFAFATTIRASGRHINVFRRKDEHDQFLYFVGGVLVDKPDREKLLRLTSEQQKKFLHDLNIELARLKIANSIAFPSKIDVTTRIPIEDLTEAKFIERIDDIDFAVTLTISKFRLFLDALP